MEHRIVDIHTHRRPPYPCGVVQATPAELLALPEKVRNSTEQLYCIGIHPWESGSYDAGTLSALEEAAALPCVALIGECGLDMLKGGPLYKQMLVFRTHIELSERLRKPLIIHSVRAHQQIVALRRDFNATLPWIIHGMNRKATIAESYLQAGCSLSFGATFQPEALLITPPERYYMETDESPLSIEQIAAAQAEALHTDTDALMELCAANFAGLTKFS